MLSAGDGAVLGVERDGCWYRWRPAAGAAGAAGTSSRNGYSVLDALAAPRQARAGGALADVRLLPPILPPRNVICLGKNYRAHAEEFDAFARSAAGDRRAGGEAAGSETPGGGPAAPIIFTKPAAALCGARDVITVNPEVTAALDYEIELGVVIGTGGGRIPPGDAYRHVAGYTVINDITARDLQQRHKQWFLGKSLAGATPAGPVIVSPDELPGLDGRGIRCWVNGELRQDARLGEMIFSVPEVIAVISRIFPLLPGDLIAMGTPAGVGVGFDPPRYLRDGDRVVGEIDGIGRLDNTIRFGAATEGPEGPEERPVGAHD
jgi:2-keto-4-pentenoate hydratase/2-oxohepta-3-ene-1,7-dioic acid hydratase in catechol pathway